MQDQAPPVLGLNEYHLIDALNSASIESGDEMNEELKDAVFEYVNRRKLEGETAEFVLSMVEETIAQSSLRDGTIARDGLIQRIVQMCIEEWYRH